MNLGDNAYPGNIVVEIAEIVSNFKFQELDISDCMFSVSELKKFRSILKERIFMKRGSFHIYWSLSNQL